MKLARLALVFLAVLFSMAGAASAYMYQGHYSAYYGSAYRPYYNHYRYYGPAVYTATPHYTIGLLGDGYYYQRYHPVNYYYSYRDPYYTNYRYVPTYRYWWTW